ncbi:MAG: tetratricopeptide repeat protein [Reichenbachiella sp.]
MKRVLVVLLVVSLFSCENEERGRGDVLYAKEEYKEAIVAYNEYLKLHPEHIKSLYNRGRSFEELRQFDKAAKDFKAVVEIDAKNTSALLSLSKYNYRIKKYDEARYYAETAVKLHNDLPEGHFWLARAYHHLGLFNEAMTGYNNAINLDRSMGEAYLYRGAIKMAGDRKKSACADFQTAKKNGVKEAEDAIKKYCK